MSKSATFTMRLDPALRHDSEKLFELLGLTLPDAIRIFLKQAQLVGGMPFPLIVPRANKATQDALDEARGIIEGRIEAKPYHSAEELFRELDANR